MNIPTEIFAQIIQSSVVKDTSAASSIHLTSSLFNAIMKTNAIKAALFIGHYGDSVYASLLSCNPSRFTPQILGAIAELRNESIPNGVYQMYKRTTPQCKDTLSYLSTHCSNTDDSVEFMELFNEYVSATKIDSEIQDRSQLIANLKAFMCKTKFIPAYTTQSRIFYILENLPVCLFEESSELALYICMNAGLSKEDINAKMVSKIMWDYGYLRQWSSTAEKNTRVKNVMELGNFKLGGKAVTEIIRRNTWVNWAQDLMKEVSKDELETAVKIVIEDNLKRKNGGGYLVAQRLSSAYSIAPQFIDTTYMKYMSEAV